MLVWISTSKIDNRCNIYSTAITGKYVEKKEEPFHVCAGLEKAFDGVSRDCIRWSLRRRRVQESVMNMVITLYVNTSSMVKKGQEHQNNLQWELEFTKGQL